jgi:tripartite-type tricarboxylate transporter receptor subunit TctC
MENRPMRQILAWTLSLAAILASPAPANAQQVPSTVRLVVPFAAGAGTDVLARAVAAQLGPRLGTTVIVENRTGGAGMIGAAAVAKGPKDGSMLLFSSSSLVTTAAAMRTVPFDFTKDLAPVAMVSDGPMVVGVSAATGIKTPAELIEFARKKEGGFVACSGGIASVGHLAAELLADAAKVGVRHIPYRGAAPAVVDLAAGTVDVLVASYTTLAPQIKSGRVVPVAVTSLNPSPAFPGIPPMATAAPGYQTGIFYAMFAPAGVSAELLHRLNKEVNEIAASRELQDLQRADGAVPMALGQAELARHVRDTYDMWKKVSTGKKISLD